MEASCCCGRLRFFVFARSNSGSWNQLGFRHGVRVLAGTTRLHVDLERKIADFKGAEEAMVLSSGYVTNLGVIAALLGRNDVVISDKLNHASIVDGCLLSRAKFVRFDHNDMAALEKALASAPSRSGKLVVADAVFSMDGDVIDRDPVSMQTEY